MGYEQAFQSNTSLVEKLGEGNAHLVWAIGLYLQEGDLEGLAAEALTDGPNDKKIDFIYLDRDRKRIILAQGYYSATKKDTAPTNKAADLNTAAAWLFAGDLSNVPANLQAAIQECRDALDNGEVEAIELLYVHNLPESESVNRELQTAVAYLQRTLADTVPVVVQARELGSSRIQQLFMAHESHIEIRDTVRCPAKVEFSERGPSWKASILSVPGTWLHELFQKYGEQLFSANYRGFLGIRGRRGINTGIRQTAETRPSDFWVYNNGITLLTHEIEEKADGTYLKGISIINGAQTTGSIGSVDTRKYDLKNVKVLCRVIECTDPDTVRDIVKYNNTQNEITTWDQHSNDPEQRRIESEFAELGYKYSRKRGFNPQGGQIGIEEVAQPLVAFHGRWRDANRGKNYIFERKALYENAFEGKKARHILLVYTLARAIDDWRIELKRKSAQDELLEMEESSLNLLRSLRFKPFLIAVVAHVLEAIVGRRVTVETVAFSREAARLKPNSIESLVEQWRPVVNAVLLLVSHVMSVEQFNARLTDDTLLGEVSQKVRPMLVISGAPSRFKEFASLIVDS